MNKAAGKQGRRSAKPVLGVLLGLALVAGPASAGPPPGRSGMASTGPTVSIDGRLGPCRLSGTATPGLRFQVTHQARGGAIKGRYEVRADGDGAWTADCAGRILASRDRLTFRRRAGGHLASTPIRTFTVPLLGLKLDRAKGTMDGITTGDAKVELVVASCPPYSVDDCKETLRAPMPSGGGVRHEFHRAMPAPLVGGTLVTVEWTAGADRMSHAQQVKKVTVRLGSPKVIGFGVPGKPMVIKVKRDERVGMSSGVAGPTGRFTGKLLADGAPFPVAIGDTVSSSASSDPANATFTIPKVSLTVGKGKVTGVCFPDTTAWLTTTVPGSPAGHQSVTPDDQGALRVATPTDPGTTYRLDCVTPAGDVVQVGGVAG